MNSAVKGEQWSVRSSFQMLRTVRQAEWRAWYVSGSRVERACRRLWRCCELTVEMSAGVRGLCAVSKAFSEAL